LRKGLGDYAFKDVRKKFNYEKILIEMKNFWEDTINQQERQIIYGRLTKE